MTRRSEKMDLAHLTRVLQSLGWEVIQTISGEIQFYRASDPENTNGVIDEDGHVGFTFNDDWETIDAIRELLPSNIEVFGATD